MIATRKRTLDDDNLAGGFKALRDAIARSLGVDDGDSRIRWEARQVMSDKQGTVVVIQAI